MKRMIAILLLVLTAGVFVGCAASAQDQPAVTKPPFDHSQGYDPSTLDDHKINPDIAAEILYWDAFRSGGEVGSGFYTRVFTDFDSFSKEIPMNTRELSERYGRDCFDKAFVTARCLVANTGGWSYEVTSASVNGGVLTVNVGSKAPDGEATQALERHVVLLAVDRACYTEGLTVNVILNGKVMSSGSVF